MNKIESLDLEVKEFIKEAESDSSIKASLERTMGINWYSKALFQLLSRKYCLGDFTALSVVFYQITGTQLEGALNIGKKVCKYYYINDPIRDYIACEGYAEIISGKRKVINNE
jgi:hypothetical protein